MKDRNNPLVSIIMSAYNTDNYIEESIKSVLNQSYSNFELICIDDCSNDNTRKIIQTIAKNDKRVRVILNKHNMGAAKSRNYGIKNALGKYIAIMDSDDIAHTMRIEKQVRELEEKSFIFLCCTDWIAVTEKNRYIKRCYTNTPTPESVYNGTAMWRNESKYKYRTNFKAAEDYDLFLRMRDDSKAFANIGEPLLRYRLRKNSVSRDSVGKTMAYQLLAKHYSKERASGKKDSYNALTNEEIRALMQNITTDGAYFLAKIDNYIMEQRSRKAIACLVQHLKINGLLNQDTNSIIIKVLLNIYPVNLVKWKINEILLR